MHVGPQGSRWRCRLTVEVNAPSDLLLLIPAKKQSVLLFDFCAVGAFLFFPLSGQRFRFPPSRHLQCALNTFVDITNAGGFIVGVFFFRAQFGFVLGSNIVCMRRWLDGLVAVVGLRRLGGADEDPNVRCRRRRPLHRQRHPAEGLQRNTR